MHNRQTFWVRESGIRPLEKEIPIKPPFLGAMLVVGSVPFMDVK